ncbi:MAG: hypothetical protein ACRC0X_00895, partial [Brevinema sp.]
MALCEEMETLIRNHKAAGIKNTTKRVRKREIELEVMALFKREAEAVIKRRKQEIKAQRSESGGQNSVQSPPPYEGGGQLPLLQGKLGVQGEMDVCGEVEITDLARRQQGENGKKSVNKGMRLDCYKEVKAELRRLNEQGTELPDPELRMVTVDEWFDEEQGNKSRYKSTSTPKFQCPIVVKGSQFNYVPWTSMDLGGLVSRLPDLSEGAGKWIKLLEDEVQGKM